MVSVKADLGRNFIIVGHHETAVTERVQIFEWMGRKGPDSTEGAAMSTASISAHGLCRIFDYRKTMAFGNLSNRLHVGDPASPMNGHDRLGSRSDPALDFGRIYI